MNKLIQTNFTYSAFGRNERGSYLGRRRASLKTLRKFVTGNAVKCGLDPKEYTEIAITGSHVSCWISK